MSGPRKLAIYDFDWTLFRSPLPPRKGVRWWSEPVSLCPPIVPKRPGKQWWISEVVAEMKHDQRHRGTVTSVITGRRGIGVRGRVRELLRQERLRPDVLRFHDDVRGNGRVLDHKVHSLNEILARCPTIVELEVWEDSEPQLEVFARAARKMGLEYTPHLVTVMDQESS